MAIEMIRNTDGSDRIHRLAALASKQHELMSQMIIDLLDTMVLKVSNSRAIDFEELELHSVVEEVVEAAKLSSGRSIAVQAEQISGFWNRQGMRRAIENLVSNAIKYSHSETPIDISLKNRRGHAILVVSNSGEKIPSDQLEAIFQLFRRAERHKNRSLVGWGIGLPYVRSVAERHAGGISVESNESVTRFTLDVPIDPRPFLAQLRTNIIPEE